MMGEKKKETLKKANRWGEKGLFGGAIQVCTYTITHRNKIVLYIIYI